jgi:hypothetical protein
LYSNDAQLWPKEGHDLVCKTIFALIDGVRGVKCVVQIAIDEGKVTKEDFMFEKYFGPEIIP